MQCSGDTLGFLWKRHLIRTNKWICSELIVAIWDFRGHSPYTSFNSINKDNFVFMSVLTHKNITIMTTIIFFTSKGKTLNIRLLPFFPLTKRGATFSYFTPEKKVHHNWNDPRTIIKCIHMPQKISGVLVKSLSLTNMPHTALILKECPLLNVRL